MQKIILKPKKDAAVRRFHPWVFSGAIAHQDDDLTDGDVVEVFSSSNEYLATGHYQPDASIAVRLFSFERTDAAQPFWTQKIRNAHRYRTELNLTNSPSTTCYRLLHAEGDGLPGLIMDVYNDTAVLQCHSAGMHRHREQLVQALLEVYDHRLNAIYDKSADTLPQPYARTVYNQYLFGPLQPAKPFVLENNLPFQIDWEHGQKTGFFLDQRDNRALLARYATHKTVLNTFAYTGGFSLYALRAGAAFVHSVDVSRKALDILENNIQHSGFTDRHTARAEEVLRFLQQTNNTYDLIVVDPPAFAKSVSKRHNAVQGYKRLNALALQKLTPGGLLFTFSCSQVVNPQLFQDTLVAAAFEAGRRARILHHLTQPPDHPVSIFHPEGAYLKGLVLYVE
jgi:23S rRNA (cytosine1962-C5)-methyltransferase